MPHPPEAPAQPNIQDAFLNQVRRERLPVTIHMMDGTDVGGRIKEFDRFAVIVERDGADQLIFKHAIATIQVPPGAAGEGPPDRS
jgi:host factor-I protein